MSDPVVTLRLKADGSGLKAEVIKVKGDIIGLGNTSDAAGSKAQRGFNKASKGVSGLEKQLQSAKRLVLGFIGAQAGLGAVRGLIRNADQYANLSARIKISTRSAEDFVAAQKGVFAVSQRTSTSLEATTTLFQRLARALDGNVEKSVAVAETINQAFAVSGATGAEARNTVIQLSQALASGVLRGDEFRSVMEQSPRIVQALTDSLNVNIGTLRKMANQGQLTTKIIIDALTQQAQVIGEQFSKLPLTVERSVTQLSNAWERFIGQASQASGASRELADIIQSIAQNLDAIIDVAIRATKVVIAYALATRGAALATRLLSSALSVLVSRSIAAELGITATATAARSATLAFTTLNGAALVVFAGIAGWQGGAILRDQFLQARLAGLALVDGLLKAWEEMKFGFNVAVAAMSKGFELFIGSIKSKMADVLDFIAKAQSLGSEKVAAATQALADRLRAGTVRSESLSDAIKRLRGETNAAKKAIDANIDGLVDYEISADLASKATKTLAKQIKAEIKATAAASGITKDAVVAMREQADTLQRAIEVFGKTKTQILELDRQKALDAATTDKQRKAINALFDPNIKLQRQLTALRSAQVKETAATTAATAALREKARVLRAAKEASVNLIISTAEEIRTLQADIIAQLKGADAVRELAIAREVARRAALAMAAGSQFNAKATEAEVRQLFKLRTTLSDLQNDFADTKDAGCKSTTEVAQCLSDSEEEMKRTMDDFSGAGADMWEQFFRDGQFSLRSLVDEFGRASQDIQGGFGAFNGVDFIGGSGQNSDFGIGGGRVGGVNSDSALGRLGIGQGPIRGGATGAQVGGQIGGGFGALIGGIIGAIGGLFGRGKTPRVRVGSGSEATGRESVFATGLGLVGIDFRRITDDIQQQIIDALQAFDASIAEFLTPDEIASVSGALDGLVQQFKKGDITLANILQDRFDAIVSSFDVVDGTVALLRDFGGEIASIDVPRVVNPIRDAIHAFGGDLEAQIATLSTALDIRSRVTAGTALLGPDTTLAANLRISEQLRKEGETLAQVYDRLTAATALYEAALNTAGIAFDGTREMLVRFASDIADAAGGIDNAASLWQSYFTSFFSNTELLQSQIEALRPALESQLAALGLAADTTKDQFRAAFETALAGDLAPDAVVQWLQAAQALGVVVDLQGQLNDALGTTGQLTADEIQRQKDLAGLLRGVGNSLQDLGLSDYEAAVLRIQRATADTLQRATDLGASEEELARIRALESGQIRELTQARAADLADLLQGVTDALDANRLTDFQRGMRDIARKMNDTTRAAIALGASQSDLAQIQQLAAQRAEALIAALTDTVSSQIDQLFGTDRLSQINDQINAIDTAQRNSISGIGQARTTQLGQELANIQRIKDFLDSLVLGNLSPLTPRQRLDEAKRQFDETLKAAQGGDAAAINKLPQVAQAFLGQARDFFASSGGFQDIFTRVTGALRGITDAGAARTGVGANIGLGPQTGGTVNAEDLAALIAERDRLLAQQRASQERDIALSLAANLRDLADATGQSILDLAHDLGVPLQDFVAALGVNLEDLTLSTTLSLADVAQTLGANLSGLAGRLGVDLGSIRDANSLINDSLESRIAGLPPDIGTTLTPLLRAVETAVTSADATSSLDILETAVNALAPDLRDQLAPFFKNVLPSVTQDIDLLGQVVNAQGTANDLLRQIIANTDPTGLPQFPGGQFVGPLPQPSGPSNVIPFVPLPKPLGLGTTGPIKPIPVIPPVPPPSAEQADETIRQINILAAETRLLAVTVGDKIADATTRQTNAIAALQR